MVYLPQNEAFYLCILFFFKPKEDFPLVIVTKHLQNKPLFNQ